MKRRSFISVLAAMPLMGVLSCTPESLPQAAAESAQMQTVTLSLGVPEMREATKTITTSAESTVDGYTLGIYDSGGDLFWSGDIEGDGTVDVLLYSGDTYTFAALVNMGDMTEDLPSRAEQLRDMEYMIPEGVWNTNMTVIPMAGLLEDVTPAATVTVPVERLFAKVKLTVDVSDLVKVSFGVDYFPGFIYIRNVNRRMRPFDMEHCTAITSDDVLAEGDNIASTSAGAITGKGGWNSTAKTGTFTFYVPANMQGTLLPDNTDPYKKNITSLRNAGFGEDFIDKLTYIEINGKYNTSTALSFTGSMIFRFYIGRDNVTNFDIEANTAYDITATLLFDTAVTGVDWKCEHGDDWQNNRLFIWKNQTLWPERPSPETWNPQPEYSVTAGSSTLVYPKLYYLNYKSPGTSGPEGYTYTLYEFTKNYLNTGLNTWKWTDQSLDLISKYGLTVNFDSQYNLLSISALNAKAAGRIWLEADIGNGLNRAGFWLNIRTQGISVSVPEKFWICSKQDVVITGFSGTGTTYSITNLSTNSLTRTVTSATGLSVTIQCSVINDAVQRFRVTKAASSGSSAQTVDVIVQGMVPYLGCLHYADGGWRNGVITPTLDGVEHRLAFEYFEDEACTQALPKSTFDSTLYSQYLAVTASLGTNDGCADYTRYHTLSTASQGNTPDGYPIWSVYVHRIHYNGVQIPVSPVKQFGHVKGQNSQYGGAQVYRAGCLDNPIIMLPLTSADVLCEDHPHFGRVYDATFALMVDPNEYAYVNYQCQMKNNRPINGIYLHSPFTVYYGKKPIANGYDLAFEKHEGGAYSETACEIVDQGWDGFTVSFRAETGKGWGHHELNARMYNSRCGETFRQTIFDCDLELVKRWTLDITDYSCTAAQLGDNGAMRAKIFSYLNSYENVNTPDGDKPPYYYNEQKTREESIYNVLETGSHRVAEAYGVSQAFFRPLTGDSGILFWRNGTLNWYDAVGNCDPSGNFRFKEVSCRISGSDYVPEWRAEEQSLNINIQTYADGNGEDTKDWLYCDDLQKTSKWDVEMWMGLGMGNIFLPFLAWMDNTHAQLGDTLTGMVYLGNSSDFSTSTVHGRQVAFRYLVWGGADAAHMDEYEKQAQEHVLSNIPFGQFYQ